MKSNQMLFANCDQSKVASARFCEIKYKNRAEMDGAVSSTQEFRKSCILTFVTCIASFFFSFSFFLTGKLQNKFSPCTGRKKLRIAYQDRQQSSFS